MLLTNGSIMDEKLGFLDFRAFDAEQRQYLRLPLLFPVSWFSGAPDEVAGIGTEISAGGIQFLLKQELPELPCSIVFEIRGRKMSARINIVRRAEATYGGEPWNCYGAAFDGLRESDFNFIIALSEREGERHSQAVQTGSPLSPLNHAPPTTSRASISSARWSNRLLPDAARERIVDMLVEMNRLDAVRYADLALLSIHYVGLLRPAIGDFEYHRFTVRSKKMLLDGPYIYNTQFLVSDDGCEIRYRM